MKQGIAVAVCASMCASVGALAQSAGSAETDLWNAIDPGKPCEYRAYLEDYPKGRYASLARLRLEACKTEHRGAAAAAVPGSAEPPVQAVQPQPATPPAAPAASSAVPATSAGTAAPPQPGAGPAAVPVPSFGAAPAVPVPSSGAARTAAAATSSGGAPPDTPAGRLESLIRQRTLFNCAPDRQSITVSAGVLSYAACGFDGSRVKGSAPLSALAIQRSSLKPLDDVLMQREPALKDYLVLSIPCSRGACYSLEVSSANGEHRFVQDMGAMAFYVPRSGSEEYLTLVKALASPDAR